MNRDDAAEMGRQLGSSGLVVLGAIGLVLYGLSAALWLGWREEAHSQATAKKSPAGQEQLRAFTVQADIDPSYRAAVWNIVMRALPTDRCSLGRAWSVRPSDGRSEHAVAQTGGAAGTDWPTGFILFCQELGYWLIEIGTEPARVRSLGPFTEVGEVEAMIDSQAVFHWMGRRPHLRAAPREQGA